MPSNAMPLICRNGTGLPKEVRGPDRQRAAVWLPGRGVVSRKIRPGSRRSDRSIGDVDIVVRQRDVAADAPIGHLVGRPQRRSADQGPGAVGVWKVRSTAQAHSARTMSTNTPAVPVLTPAGTNVSAFVEPGPNRRISPVTTLP